MASRRSQLPLVRSSYAHSSPSKITLVVRHCHAAAISMRVLSRHTDRRTLKREKMVWTYRSEVAPSLSSMCWSSAIPVVVGAGVHRRGIERCTVALAATRTGPHPVSAHGLDETRRVESLSRAAARSPRLSLA